MSRFTYYAASYGHSQCDAMGTAVSLKPGYAWEAAKKSADDEENESRNSCPEDECPEGDECQWCNPRIWLNGEHAFSADALFSAKELMRVRRELLAGEVVWLER